MAPRSRASVLDGAIVADDEAPVTRRLNKPTVAPRLLDYHQAGVYLSLAWTSVRELVATGKIPTVRPPACNGSPQDMRKILIDVRDLDRLIEQWKHAR